MKLEVPSDFLAPSSLDYSAYCRTVYRGGFDAGDKLSTAMACYQEARQWKKTGNFDEVTPETILGNEPNDVWEVSPNKVSLKYAIHSMCFLVCEFKNAQILIACGYDKHGLLFCHPSEKSFGTWGKTKIPWSVIAKGMVSCWGVF